MINLKTNIKAKIAKYKEKQNFLKNNIVSSDVLSRFNITRITGVGNSITVLGQVSKTMNLYISGNNNVLYIDKNVNLLNGILYIEDDNNEIYIGKGTSIYDAEISTAEGKRIHIGENCLLSKEIRICTTDSHSVIDKESGNRINPAANIHIGNHVWIGYRTSINKGVNIGDDSIIGGGSIVTHDIPENSCAVGVPAKVVKQNVSWIHKRI